ncbi:hypothetical protein B6V75_10085 [Thioclava sp. F1Mire-8]|uniref:hypothetical protein n=1 Tax=Thioclava sp. F1Mire-8 TaxID=1973006 RepID=UPI000B53B211|nr:hypothetical protein [Thioclava sp. F1Mire-8]OWY03760.1 hypothetical protein B6V75_10085 [Thioclava sp. F1Mire-8]
MFQRPNRIGDVNTMAREAIDALVALPVDALRGAECDRDLCERLVIKGEVLGDEFREAGADLLRHLARIEPDETIVRKLDNAMRRLRDAINGSFRTAVAFGVEHASSIQRAA